MKRAIETVQKVSYGETDRIRTLGFRRRAAGEGAKRIPRSRYVGAEALTWATVGIDDLQLTSQIEANIATHQLRRGHSGQKEEAVAIASYLMRQSRRTTRSIVISWLAERRRNLSLDAILEIVESCNISANA